MLESRKKRNSLFSASKDRRRGWGRRQGRGRKERKECSLYKARTFSYRSNHQSLVFWTLFLYGQIVPGTMWARIRGLESFPVARETRFTYIKVLGKRTLVFCFFLYSQSHSPARICDYLQKYTQIENDKTNNWGRKAKGKIQVEK